MAEGLTGFIRAAMRREFVWGERDCALFCADWALRVTGHDMGAIWRGKYDSEAGAMAFIAAAGGLVALFDEGTAGVLERCAAEDALVGVITSPEGDVGAIRSGMSWVVLTERGIGRVRLDLPDCLAAWRLPCPRS
jgi:hypothetical protein